MCHGAMSANYGERRSVDPSSFDASIIRDGAQGLRKETERMR